MSCRLDGDAGCTMPYYTVLLRNTQNARRNIFGSRLFLVLVGIQGFIDCYTVMDVSWVALLRPDRL